MTKQDIVKSIRSMCAVATVFSAAGCASIREGINEGYNATKTVVKDVGSLAKGTMETMQQNPTATWAMVSVLGIASDHSIAKDDNKVRRTAIKSREKVAEKGIEAWKEVETLKAQQNERE